MGTNACCGNSLRSQVAGKLGKCWKCMRASAVVALIGWIAVTFAAVFLPEPAFLVPLVPAALSSALLVAHVTAFAVGADAAWRAQTVSGDAPIGLSLNRRRFFIAVLGGVSAALFGPAATRWTAVGDLRLASDASAQQPPPCRLLLRTGANGTPPYVWICEGSCPPLFMDNPEETEVAGTCTLARRANPNGEATGMKECFCVYEPPGATCAVQRNARTGQFTCTGDCPDLFTAKRGERGRRRANKQCIRVEAPVAGGYEIKCICVYS